MAFMNKKHVSELGDRIQTLIRKHNEGSSDCWINSLKDLATAFYDLQLVHVNTRENFNDPQRDRNNAISSIEKKIERHINSGIITDKSGEYILAYVRFFNCSADYLLGLTPIMSSDMQIRRICERTGLSEKSVINLIENAPAKGDKDVFSYTQWWSDLLSSDLFERLPRIWMILSANYHELYLLEAKIQAIGDAMKKMPDLDPVYKGQVTAKEFTLRHWSPKIRGALEGSRHELLNELNSFLEEKAMNTAKHGSVSMYEQTYNEELKEWKAIREQLKLDSST